MVSLTAQGDKGTFDGKKTDELMMKTHTHVWERVMNMFEILKKQKLLCKMSEGVFPM